MKISDFTGNSADDIDAGEHFKRAELVVEQKSGRVRQAGADQAEGKLVLQFKARCETSLYCFLDGVLNYYWLYAPLHKPVCEWLTRRPPYRKMLLMPRNHCKSTIVGRGIPLHVMIQSLEKNIYFPGEPGANLRCVMAGETEARSVGHLRVIKGALENNVLLRALWPHIVWENPRRQSSKWSDTEIIIPRDRNFPEPTITGIGVGGAITGMHPNMLLKDDLTTERAANEPPTMQKAIEWHLDSRALFENPEENLEYITATYWAAYDLPNFIEQNDKTVEANTDWRAVVKDGEVIYPTKYGYPGAVQQLQAEHGNKFPLLFMNTVTGSDLTDFNLADVRWYEKKGDVIRFTEDERDIALDESLQGPEPERPEDNRGLSIYEALDLGKLEHLRRCRAW